jgi:hypothetical protein
MHRLIASPPLDLPAENSSDPCELTLAFQPDVVLVEVGVGETRRASSQRPATWSPAAVWRKPDCYGLQTEYQAEARWSLVGEVLPLAAYLTERQVEFERFSRAAW